MINRLYIENYTSFDTLDIELKRVNVIYGTTGSGKTNLINALKMIKSSINGVYSQGKSFSNYDNPDDIFVVMQYPRFVCSLRISSENLLLKSEKVDGINSEQVSVDDINREVGSWEFYSYTNINRNSTEKVFSYLQNLQKTSYPQYFFLISLLQEVMPIFQDFVLDSGNLKWRVSGYSKDLDFRTLPDNFIKFFGLALLFYQQAIPNLIVIDNIDAGLDFKMLRLLADMIYSSSAQIITTTNSLSFLNYFNLDDVLYFENKGITKAKKFSEATYNWR